jgi:hypothetical protein
LLRRTLMVGLLSLSTPHCRKTVPASKNTLSHVVQFVNKIIFFSLTLKRNFDLIWTPFSNPLSVVFSPLLLSSPILFLWELFQLTGTESPSNRTEVNCSCIFYPSMACFANSFLYINPSKCFPKQLSIQKKYKINAQ